MVSQLRTIFLALLLLVCGNMTSAQPDTSKNGDEVPLVIKMIQKAFNCNSEVADNFLYFLETNLDTIQYLLSQVASSESTEAEKKASINQLLTNHFLPGATVQVSSTKRVHKETIKIGVYLDRLSRIEDLYKYRKVELFFDPEFAKLEIHNTKEFDDIIVTTQQFFMGCQGESNGCYTDMTFKQFRFRYNEVAGNQQLKISSIRVTETIEIDLEAATRAYRKWERRWEPAEVKTEDKTADK